MGKSRWLVVLVAAVLALVVAGCGGVTTRETGAEAAVEEARPSRWAPPFP